jgi:hypothetical protein
MMNALPTATNGFKEEQILLAVSGERQRTSLSRNMWSGEGSKRLGACCL